MPVNSGMMPLRAFAYSPLRSRLSHTSSEVRDLIEQHGAFIEIHVATSLEVCESRDRKGLYAKARKGIIPEFTGISDPYEVPEKPELRIDTANKSPMQAAQAIMLYLLSEGYLDLDDEQPAEDES